MISRKMVEGKAFLVYAKHQYHVPQWGERVYGGQSQKEWKLFWVSTFVSFHGWTLILREMIKGKAILWKPKH